MKIAYVMSTDPGAVDEGLRALAEALMARGITVAGIVQTNIDCGPDRHCDMDVQVLPNGPVLRISQTLGTASEGCRLNPDALERAVGLVGQGLGPATGCLIVNKFGKQEAEGRGFRELIGAALAQGTPVVVGLNGVNRPAFEAYAGDLAQPLVLDPGALLEWVETARHQR